MEEGFIIEKLKIERDREGTTVITVKMNNRGVEPPYKGDYDLIKQDRKQSFVSMYLEGRVEQYTPGWWKVL